MNNKISIWDYYVVPMNTYLSYGSEEKTKMFKEYYKSQKYYGNGKIGVIVSFLKMVSFFMFLMLFALFSASDHFCVVPFQLVSVHRPWWIVVLLKQLKKQINFLWRRTYWRVETAQTAEKKKILLREIPLTFGWTMVFLSISLVVLGWRRKTYQRIPYSTSTEAINRIRTIKKSTMEIFLLFVKLTKPWTLPKTLVHTISRKRKCNSTVLGMIQWREPLRDSMKHLDISWFVVMLMSISSTLVILKKIQRFFTLSTEKHA